MFIPVVLFLIGLILLIKGGDWFVDGAVGIATKMHIPKLLIGATVVSIGTTLPEVFVSVTSSLSGHGDIAYGNAIGSIICNAGLIAALSIIALPTKIESASLRIPTSFFFISASFYLFAAYYLQEFTRTIGVILIILFFLYLFFTAKNAKKASPKEKDMQAYTTFPTYRNIFLLVIGAILIAIGADFLVNNGIIIAQGFGLSETVIALTFVALGTSLPELVTAVSSLIKGHGTLPLGNIIGANILNLVLVSGLSAFLSPFSVPTGNAIHGIPSTLILDLPVLIISMLLLCIPPLVMKKISRLQGFLLLTLYFSFILLQFIL